MLSDTELANIFKFHFVLGEALTYDELECKIKLKMANGWSSRTKCAGGEKYQKGQGNYETGTLPMIVKESSNIEACNGIVHVLDHVMFPKHSGMEAAVSK